MSDYMPLTGIVKAAYVVHMNHYENIEHKVGVAEFDTWLAEHDRQIAEAAWSEGYQAGVHDERIAAGWDYPATPGRANPYKEQP